MVNHAGALRVCSSFYFKRSHFSDQLCRTTHKLQMIREAVPFEVNTTANCCAALPLFSRDPTPLGSSKWKTQYFSPLKVKAFYRQEKSKPYIVHKIWVKITHHWNVTFLLLLIESVNLFCFVEVYISRHIIWKKKSKIKYNFL